MSKITRELGGLFFIIWGVAVWIGFILVNVGPCNNRDIPLERSTPIVVSMIAYWIVGTLRLFQKDAIWFHYVIWGCAGFLVIAELPFLNDRQDGWYIYFLIVALLLVTCAPSIVFRLNSLPSIQNSPRKRKIITWSVTVACAALLSWIFGPIAIEFL